MNYIDSSDLIENEERYQYAIMQRNILSDNERFLMFYYYAACNDWHKTMAEEYALFYDVLPNRLAKEEHYDLFEENAIIIIYGIYFVYYSKSFVCETSESIKLLKTYYWRADKNK